MVKKLILVDGNNLMFRSYYATAYTGNMMKNSKGVPTNALFGFVGMINKIIAEEKPQHSIQEKTLEKKNMIFIKKEEQILQKN